MIRIERPCRLTTALPRPPSSGIRRQARHLHLAPPFLLDDYVPRYQMLGTREAALKRSKAYAHLRNCNLCPRLCGVNRYQTTGMCLIGDKAKNSQFCFGDTETCIQGHNGSGAVFMSGCNLRCVFCQNHDISHQRNGMDLTPEELGDWYLKLQTVGNVHNINIVTPEHVVPQVALSILHARELGLNVPIVYNTSSFDSLASLELMDGLVDIYLADFKVWEPATSKRLLKSDDYAATAKESVKAMHAQVGDLCFTGDGIAKQGLLIRHLVMPGREREGVEIMRYLASEVSKDCFVNIMEQYSPRAHVGKTRRGKAGIGEVRYGDINRPVNESEVTSVREAAEAAGLWRFNEPPKHDGFAI
ncbi:radical SAM superfamily protein [Cordyceps javanica]|uniref:Radical SAM superfamily protein n=1 Tax=Cordyceps javanica TaxID=43265 RepID=A0A545UTS2_9HYPO|nr:radical SAM superfamily protein [Cordyceps javanica]TQW02139.1 radical SAM superfamily protein [Cordyceps javanica]